jgi:hypothetical protein
MIIEAINPGRQRMRGATLFVLALVLAGFHHVLAQAPSPAGVVGAITAIQGTTLTIASDKGETVQVDVPASAVLKRVPPGQRDLSAAEAIQFSDLAVGDRALVKLDPAAPPEKHLALRIIAMKQSDLAAKQQHDREDWQHRGVGGLVKSVDAASGVLVVSSGAGPTAKNVTIHTAASTVLKRYAPDSIRFDAAKPAPLDAIHAGDQLRARGVKSPDGGDLQAEEVVSGSFRNISGTIVSIDEATNTFTVKDLATKKQVTVHVTPDAQMRRLPEMMARMLAARLKGTAPAGMPPGAPPAGMPAGAPPAGAMPPRGQGFPGGGPGGPGADPQQMLNRAPAILLKDLQKGEAILLVSTDGGADLTAISLLAGVEPLLEAPAASQSLLSNWSMGGNGGGGGGGGDVAP